MSIRKRSISRTVKVSKSKSARGKPKLSRRNTLENLKFDSAQNNDVIGVPLASTITRDSRLYNIPDLKIPLALDVILSHIENVEKNIEGEVLIEASPTSAKVIEIMEQFEAGNYQISRREDGSILCGLLKLYLQNLPDSLIPMTEYKVFMDKVGRIDRIGTEKCCQEIKELLNYQAEVNIICAQRVLLFLNKTVKSWWTDADQEKIIAEEFAPYILRSKTNPDLSQKEFKKLFPTYDFLVENALAIYGEYDGEGRHEMYFNVLHPNLLTTPSDQADMDDQRIVEDLFHSRQIKTSRIRQKKTPRENPFAQSNNPKPDETSQIKLWKERVSILREELKVRNMAKIATLDFLKQNGLEEEYRAHMETQFPGFFNETEPELEPEPEPEFKIGGVEHKKSVKKTGKKLKVVDLESSSEEIDIKKKSTKKTKDKSESKSKKQSISISISYESDDKEIKTMAKSEKVKTKKTVDDSESLSVEKPRDKKRKVAQSESSEEKQPTKKRNTKKTGLSKH